MADFTFRHLRFQPREHSSPIHGDLDWLSAAEREVYTNLLAPRRREEWLIGRRLAKQLILEHLNAAQSPLLPREIQIHSRDGLGRPVRPRVVLQGRLQPWSLSIAHSERSALAAFSASPGVSLGVDVAQLQTWTDRSLEMWFTGEERRWLRITARVDLASRIWAIKEAIYKAVNRGESFAPRQIEVCPQPDGRYTYVLDGAEPGATPTIHAADSDGEAIVIAIVNSPHKEVVQ